MRIKSLIESHLTKDHVVSAIIRNAYFGLYEEIFNFIKRSKEVSKCSSVSTNDGEYYFTFKNKKGKKFTLYFYPTNIITLYSEPFRFISEIESIEDIKNNCNL